MATSPNVYVILHVVVQCGFVGVTLLFLGITTAHRLRMRDVITSWISDPLPAWPTAFLGLVSLFAVYAVIADHQIPLTMYAGYWAGGVFWLGAVVLSRSVLITKYGIVRHLNHEGTQIITWIQFEDYFVSAQGEQPRYVFFYEDEQGRRRRFDLVVPKQRHERFRDVVVAKLDARFERSMKQVYGKEELEG